MIKKKETPVHSIRFPNLENEINNFAQANSLSFLATVNLLVN